MEQEFLEETDKKEKRRGERVPPFLSFVLDLVKLVVLAFIIVLPIHHFVFQPFYVVGPSMEPNFYNNEYLIIEKLNYYFNKPDRGEVVVFKAPANSKGHLIKRVIGLPGEKIVVENGQVFIYNEEFSQGINLKEEFYLTPGTRTPGKIEKELEKDEYYVLGDNRNMSLDSRSFGPIKDEDITGRVWFRGLPLKAFGLIKSPVFAY